ncbi:MAG TPA: tetratricopeptide repeat-containing serine protease family protein [Pirellulales bacterium]|jgi:tetratricopeptide (TPR) repeat protein|nr:tetratricopeptide repeat-containing serine protease family protein [Pirellulales bacterium]
MLLRAASFRPAFAVLLCLVCLSKLAEAQTDDLAKTLNLTSNSKSLPLWSKPAAGAIADLTQVVHGANTSIFIVGKPDEGFGTAFLISKEHRLLATNAHVADIMSKGNGDMMAIENGTSHVFKVVKAYYHPGVRRSMRGVTLRSVDPNKGEVDPRSPDVAVLQLASGGELPDELAMATRDELYELFAQPVGMLGFPGHDTISWPGVGQKAEATFREGVVSRITDFLNDVNAPLERQQFIQHSMANWFGFSGSPIFLTNGHVVALNNSGRTETQNGMSTALAYGVRVDCLWELLKSNHLLDQVNIPPEAKLVDVERFSEPDPTVELLNKVNRLLDDARIDLTYSRYLQAGEKCNQAAHLMPNYARVYQTRGGVYADYCAETYKFKDPQGLYYDQLAFNDARKAVELDPENSDAYLDLGMFTSNLVNAKIADGYHHFVSAVVEIADKIIDAPGVPSYTKAYAYTVRAEGRGYTPETLSDLKKADALDPYDDQIYWSVNNYYQNNDDDAQAEKFKDLSRKLQEARAKNLEAWRLATSSDDSKRDGKKAIQLATEACTVTNFNRYDYLASLAAAYAESGDYDHAVEYQQKALKLAPEDYRGEHAKRLKYFQDHNTLRQM